MSLLFSCSVVSNSLRPHEQQHARLPCPLLSPRVCSNSCPLSHWCYPTISFSVAPFSSCPQSFPALGFFPMSCLFASGIQSIRLWASALVFPVNIQGWYPLGLTSLISLLSKGLSRVPNSCPLSQWCHPTISSSVIPFSSCPQSVEFNQSDHSKAGVMIVWSSDQEHQNYWKLVRNVKSQSSFQMS